jgi:hypothetical protein
MKWLQNNISRISDDLTRNLKIRIISISVLYRYFFEIFHFHIKLNLIDIKLILNQILSFIVSIFPSLPSLGITDMHLVGNGIVEKGVENGNP